MPNGMSMSPAVDQASQVPAPEQAEQMFKERFNQMAFSVLYSKFSEMAPNVVTFKILEIDPETGRGVGVFIILHNQKPMYVPVIMADGQLKPMDMFFYKELNIFLPFTTQWLDEISKMTLDEMGQGANLPREVPQDVNIRDLILPPMTTSGRIGYASDLSLPALEFGAKQTIKAAYDQSQFQSVKPQFLNIVRNGPRVMLDGLKIAFEKSPSLLQKFASVYGVNELTAAFQEGYSKAPAYEKTASAPGKLRVFTKHSSSAAIREAFGVNAGKAFERLIKEGFAVKDERKPAHVALKVEGKVALDEPGATGGWFKLYFVDSPAGDFLVIPFPKCFQGSYYHAIGVPYSTGNDHRAPKEYLVVNKNLKEAWGACDIAGERIHESEKGRVDGSPLYKLLFSEGSGDLPKVGAYGFFVNLKNRTVEATPPITIEQSTTVDGRRKYLSENHDQTYVVDDDPSRLRIETAMNAKIVFLPKNVKWVTLKQDNISGEKQEDKYKRYDRNRFEFRKNSVVKDPKMIMRWMNAKLHESGAQSVNVKSAGLNQFWVEKTTTPLPFADALEKVANGYDISGEDALGILKDAQTNGRSYSFIIDLKSGSLFKTALDKWAQPPQEQPMQGQGAPGGGMPQQMDPAMQQEVPMGPGGAPPDPMAAQQQGAPQPASPPAPMSPTDLAIGEAIQQLQQQTEMQNQQLQTQMQSLQQQLQSSQQQNQGVIQVLQTIQQRSQAIAQATGGQVPPGAEQSPMMAAQAIAPTPPPQPEPPPMPMMDKENTSPEMVAQQINPQMVEQASQFNDQGMFDTAAIGMLASAPVLQDVVSTYIPNLEKAIDNIARILLTLWMKEADTKEQIGDDTFVSLEDKLRSVFKNMGEVVLSISHNALSSQDPNIPDPVGGTHANV